MISYNFVVSVNQNNLIGVNNNLLISSKEDLKNFYKITTKEYPEGSKNILIMGYKTWISIPEEKKPFQKRMNIILTQNHKDNIEESENVKSFSSLFNAFDWCKENETGRIFIIGGGKIFTECILHHREQLNIIYLTRYINDYRCGNKNVSLFPFQALSNTEIIQRESFESIKCSVYSEIADSITESMPMHFLIHQNKKNVNSSENQYLNLLRKIMKEGNKVESRNSITYSLFGERLEFDMKDGFPLFTTKKIGYKTILRELLWFMNGSTSNHKLQEKNVHIWDLNSTKEFLQNRGLEYQEGDLGPIYGFQWRHSGAKYKDCYSDYSGLGIDQLKNVIHLIQNEPSSRRIIMNSWNPSDIDKMALPPCHVMCQFNVNIQENTLNCQMYQRSGDMFLGIPFNIASYSFLLHIISKITGYKPGKFIHIIGDAHIYESHLDAVKEQVSRVPSNYPELILSDDLIDIDSLDESMFQILNYKSYSKISSPMIA
tara:strand:+ start:2879 stop:4339 length:1461 start_codon:yes stop_codon:yes gene_type:complete